MGHYDNAREYDELHRGHTEVMKREAIQNGAYHEKTIKKMEAHIEELEENLKIALEALEWIRDQSWDANAYAVAVLQQIKECEG